MTTLVSLYAVERLNEADSAIAGFWRTQRVYNALLIFTCTFHNGTYHLHNHTIFFLTFGIRASNDTR
jgi:hypothetical protein